MPFHAILDKIRSQKPLVHCISNIVTANDCANLLLAIGASPMMAQAPEEMEEITAIALSLPEHTVVPYANIPKKQYPKNIPLEVYSHEETAG